MLCQHSHAPDLGLSRRLVNGSGPSALGSKAPLCSFRLQAIEFWERAKMTKRIVESATEARQGTKEGVVRYVLVASLVLVVVLFVVAYELFS